MTEGREKGERNDEATVVEARPGASTDVIARPPVRIGRFEILGEIGRGGMGIVLSARDPDLDREVAIKRIAAAAFATDADRARFLREARLAAALSHPGIVRVLEVGTEQGYLYCVLDRIDGEELDRFVDRGEVGRGEIGRILLRIAEAVAHLHERGVIHRDLKPANVMMTPDGAPVLIDFGLARRVEQGGTLTVDGAILGTPSFMSPEQATGGEEIGPLADVYGLGATLYYCLTGQAPFRGSSLEAVLNQVRTRDPIHPRELDPEVDLDLATIALRCMEKEPSRRYSGAMELVEELRRHVEGRPILARPPSWAGRLWKFVRRHPIPFATGGAAFAVVVAVVALAFLSILAALGERSDALEREQEALEEVRQKSRAEAAALAESNRVRGFDLLNRHDYRGALREAIGALRTYSERGIPERDLRGIRFLYASARVNAWREVAAPLPREATAIAVDAEGRNLYVAREGEILVFDTSTWERETLTGRAAAPIQRILVRKNDLLVAEEGDLVRWSLETGRLGRHSETGLPEGLALSPDGRRLLVMPEPGKFQIWSADRAELEAEMDLGDRAPDRSSVAWVTAEQIVTSLYRPTRLASLRVSRERLGKDPPEETRVPVSAFDAKTSVLRELERGRFIVVGASNGQSFFYSLRPLGMMRALEAHDAAVTAAGADREGLFATGSARGEVLVHALAGEAVQRLEVPGGSVLELVLAAGPTLIVRTSGRLTCWRPAAEPLGIYQEAVPHPDGRGVLMRTGRTIVWRSPGGGEDRSIEIPDLTGNLVLSPSGGRFAVEVDLNGTRAVRVFDTDDGAELGVSPNDAAPFGFRFLDETRLLGVESEGRLVELDLAAGAVRTLEPDLLSPRGTMLRLSPDGSRIAVVERLGEEVIVCDVASGRVVSRIPWPGSTIVACDWVGDNLFLVSDGGEWKEIHSMTGRPIRAAQHGFEMCRSIDVLPGWEVLAARGPDQVRLLDLHTLAELCRLPHGRDRVAPWPGKGTAFGLHGRDAGWLHLAPGEAGDLARESESLLESRGLR